MSMFVLSVDRALKANSAYNFLGSDFDKCHFKSSCKTKNNRLDLKLAKVRLTMYIINKIYKIITLILTLRWCDTYHSIVCFPC